jgi:thioredoxin-like negative regulator of GroEL
MATTLISFDEFKNCTKSDHVIILFKSNRCEPSMRMMTIFDKFAVKYNKRLKFAKIDIDEIKEVVYSVNVGAIPECIVYKKGKLESRQLCTMGNLEKYIQDFLSSDDEEEDDGHDY